MAGFFLVVLAHNVVYTTRNQVDLDLRGKNQKDWQECLKDSCTAITYI